MLKLILILAFLIPSPLLASSIGPETADQVRARRDKQQLEENRRKQEHDALAAELGDMPEIDPALIDEYTEIIDIIADPSMEGRVPGSRGIEDAAEYIEEHLKALNLTPPFPTTETAADGTEIITPFSSYRQIMQMGSQTAATTEKLSVGDTNFTAGPDFSPLAYSGSGSVTAPLSFAGYAIVSGPNNYLGFETNESVQGRIALVLNYEPMDDAGHSLWHDEGWSNNAKLTYKISALQRRGAAAVIIVSPPNADDDRVGLLETIESTSPPANRIGRRTGPQYDIPVIHATADVARSILKYTATQSTLGELIVKANQRGIVQSLGDKPISLDIEIERTPKMTHNIGAILPGRGKLKDQYIVIGSHYDHVGYGKFGSRAPGRIGEVHPGADDNASGTTANLICAQVLTQRYELLADNQDARSILFLWFTAEESGLNGSRYYTEHPIAPIEDHVMMLNMDMIGSLDDELLEIGGLKSNKDFERFAEPLLKQAAIPYSEDVSVGKGRSDHASFDAVGIPSLFFFTGLTDRYHTPDDTIDFIDEEGAVRIALLVSSMGYAEAIATDPIDNPSAHKKTPKKEGPNVRVGIIPSNASDGGMMVERVFEDTSASAAGLQVGDRIVKWNDQDIDAVETWMPILTQQEPGDVVTLTIIRAQKTLELKMTLRAIE